MWRRKMALGAALPEVPTLSVSNFRETARSATTVTFGWDVAGTVTELWLYLSTQASPVASDPWATLTGVPSVRLTGATTSYEVSIPVDGSITYGRLVPIDADIARGAAWDFTAQRTGANEIPQGSVAISSAGVVTVEVDGPTWMGSVKWKASTSAYPTDAATVSTGTTAAGTQLVISTGVTLGLGETIYATVVPFSSTGAGGLQGSSMRLTGTRHDATATKTVLFSIGAVSFGGAGSGMGAVGVITLNKGPTAYINRTAATSSGGTVSVSVDLQVPQGCTLTSMSTYVYHAAAGAHASTKIAHVLRQVASDGTATVIVSGADSTAVGWQTLTDSMSQSTSANWQLIMNYTFGGAGADADSDIDNQRLQWAGYSVTYTMPSTLYQL